MSAFDLKGGRHLEIAEPTVAGLNIDQPISDTQIKNSFATMQAAAPKGYVVQKAGQARVGERIWIWHESTIPTFDLSTSAAAQEMLRAVPYRSGRSWSFVSTPHQQLLRVYCTALFPNDASAAEIERRTCDAGPVFAEFIRRLRVEPR